MKFVPAKLAAEPKWKIAMLGGLGLVLVYLLWSNLSCGGSSSTPATQARAVTAEAPSSPVASAAPVRRQSASRTGSLEDFKPSMKRARLVASDPTQVDPTLRLDLLARLQSARFEGDMRSLFEFSQAALAQIKEPKPIHPGPTKPFGPQPLPPPQVYVPPPPPPIPLKFYGFVNPARPDIKSAFFLDGEDIRVASEGETIRSRYRIVRIGVNSAVVEDTQFKNQQTLPLVAEEQG
jgi:hypothetical protein